MGLAIGAGTNVAIESADLVLIEDDPLDAVKDLNLAKKTYSKMIQNLFWATGYNLQHCCYSSSCGAALCLGVCTFSSYRCVTNEFIDGNCDN